MQTKPFKWKRFWTLPHDTIRLADGGFLPDPDTTWGRLLNPSIQDFDQIGSFKCLVLLGEPGIGKSAAIRQETERVQAQKGRQDRVLAFDLREFGRATTFIDDASGTSVITTLQAWTT